MPLDLPLFPRPFLKVASFLRSFQILLLSLLCLTLLGLSFWGSPLIQTLRVSFFDLARPVLWSLSFPVRETKKAFQDLATSIQARDAYRALLKENEQLRVWKDRAHHLGLENQKLRAQLHLLPKMSQRYLTAEVLANFQGHYTKTFVIEGGQDRGFRPHQIVVVENQVIGRVFEVGKRTSVVLLVTDLNSRVPVESANLKVQGILAGEEGETGLHLIHAQGLDALRPGDLLYTSGRGGGFPKGLKVGVVSHRSQEGVGVTSDLDWDSIHYVHVLQ